MQLFRMGKYLQKLKEDVRGMISTQSIVGLAVGLIVAAAVLPSAIVSITNTTAWEGAPTVVITLVPVIGIIAVVAVILMVLGKRH